MTDNSDKSKFEKELRAVRNTAPPEPFDVYRYLTRVREYRVHLRDRPDQRKALRKHAAAVLQANYKGRLTRLIIELTAGSHVKLKQRNKYIQALEWCENNNIPANKTKAFIRSEGGINECVAKRIRSRKSVKSQRAPEGEMPLGRR